VKQQAKRWLFRALGKDPEGVVVTFATGQPDPVEAMRRQMRELVPDRRHLAVDGGDYLTIRERLRPFRIAQACVIFDGDAQFDAMRQIAFALAPTRILAFNRSLERHHLRPSLASWLFLRGVPKDEIFHRPWTPTVRPDDVETIEGRGFRDGFPRVAIVSPYFPWPLAHGGAVRIYNLIREGARESDIVLYSFGPAEAEQMRNHCARIVLARRPVYRKPRWWGWTPPEVREFESSALRAAISGADLVQVEYTQMASYPGDVLVEHDVTFDLAEQRGATWEIARWRWYEHFAVRRYRRVVVMSEKDRTLLGVPHAAVLPNGVDLDRFQPSPEPAARRLAFIASFAHYPNVIAYRFLLEEIWPRLEGVECHIVAGRDPERYWRQFTGEPSIPAPPGVTVEGFVPDVERVYRHANLAIVPTRISAGTNLKVLEAMAAGRAIVSTPSGCAGLGLEDGVHLRIADSAGDFAAAVEDLLDRPEERARLAANARRLAEERFGWGAIGKAQAELWRDLLRR
jgi:glycosyltransferase involved in cell wall biosynthesis